MCVFLNQLDFLRVLIKLKTLSIQQAVTIMMELAKDSGRDRRGCLIVISMSVVPNLCQKSALRELKP